MLHSEKPDESKFIILPTNIITNKIENNLSMVSAYFLAITSKTIKLIYYKVLN